MNLSTVEQFKHIQSEECYFLNPDELCTLQTSLRKILFDVADVCEEAGIPFLLAGGTALGAVRHQGFIPWDDDIDLLMTRADFLRFSQVFLEKKADSYWVHQPGKTKQYPLLLGRVLKKGTVLRTREDFFNDDECGVFIDIFLMENTPDHPLLRMLHGFGSLAFGFLVSCRKFYRDRRFLLPLTAADAGLRRVFRTKIVLGFFTAFLSLDRWIQAADRWNALCRNNHSRYLSVPAGRLHYFGELYPRAAMFPSVSRSFEGRELPVMADYDLYLSRLYGDYAAIPAENHREAHAFLSPPVF